MSNSNTIFIYKTNSHSNRLYALKDVIEAGTNSKCFFYENLEQIENDLNSFFIPRLLLVSAPSNEGACKTITEQLNRHPALENTPVIAITAPSDYMMQIDLLDAGANDYIEENSPEQIFLARINSALRQRNLSNQTASHKRNRSLIANGLKNEVKSIITTFNTALGYLDLQKKKSGSVEDYANIKNQLEERLNGFRDLKIEIGRFIKQSPLDSVHQNFNLMDMLIEAYPSVIKHVTETSYLTFGPKAIVEFALSEMLNTLCDEYNVNQIKVFQSLSNQAYSNLEKPYITTVFEFESIEQVSASLLFTPTSGVHSSRLSSSELRLSFAKDMLEEAGGHLWSSSCAKTATSYIHIDFPEVIEID